MWFFANDMLLSLASLRTSTMPSTTFLNASTGVLANVWKAITTAASTNRIVTNRALTYVSGSNGIYRGVVQSTEHSMAVGTVGLSILTVNHLGLNAEWRVPFSVEYRRST
jgi:hypothetical protein